MGHSGNRAGTSRTLGENHTTRPHAPITIVLANSFIIQSIIIAPQLHKSFICSGHPIARVQQGGKSKMAKMVVFHLVRLQANYHISRHFASSGTYILLPFNLICNLMQILKHGLYLSLIHI